MLSILRRMVLAVGVCLPLLGAGCAASSGAFTNVDYRLGRREEDGVPAVMFLSAFRVRGVQSEQVKLEVTLLDKRGTPLRAPQTRYSNREGAIAAGKILPVFDGRGDYEQVLVSLPIDELRGVGKARPETARFSLYDIAGKKLLSEDLAIQLRGADLRRMLEEDGAAPSDAAALDEGAPDQATSPTESPDYAFERAPAAPADPSPAAEPSAALPAFEDAPARSAPEGGSEVSQPFRAPDEDRPPVASDSPPGDMQESWGSDQRVPLDEVLETAKRGETWVPPSDAGRPLPTPPPPPEPVQGESTVTPVQVLPPEPEADGSAPIAPPPTAPTGSSSPKASEPPARPSATTSGAPLSPVAGWSGPRRDTSAPRPAADERDRANADQPDASEGLVPVSGWNGSSGRNASPTANPSMNRADTDGPAAAAPATHAEKTREYTVKPGDSLTIIAQKLLGSSKRWRDIYRLNRDRLESPDYLPEGLKLRVPPK